MATATSSVRISSSAAGATPGIAPVGRSQAGCPCQSRGGGNSGIDSKKLTPSGYFNRRRMTRLLYLAGTGNVTSLTEAAMDKAMTGRNEQLGHHGFPRMG